MTKQLKSVKTEKIIIYVEKKQSHFTMQFQIQELNTPNTYVNSKYKVHQLCDVCGTNVLLTEPMSISKVIIQKVQILN